MIMPKHCLPTPTAPGRLAGGRVAEGTGVGKDKWRFIDCAVRGELWWEQCIGLYSYGR